MTLNLISQFDNTFGLLNWTLSLEFQWIFNWKLYKNSLKFEIEGKEKQKNLNKIYETYITFIYSH